MAHDDRRRRTEKDEIEKTKGRVLLLFGRPPRTNAEKRKAVIYVLESASDGMFCSDGWIAQACFVSRSLVAAVRKELRREAQIAKAHDALSCAWHLAPETARKRFVDFEGRVVRTADDMLGALSSGRILGNISDDHGEG